jgi:hypothetical protein
MSMHEQFPQMPSTPSPEKAVSDLEAGAAVIRNGEPCTITSYQTLPGGEIRLGFSDGDVAILDGDDTLEVPA